MKVSDSITFKGQTYTVTEVFPVTPLLAKEGLVSQAAIEGKRGTARLLQVYADGTRRTISTSGRAQTEYPAFAVAA